MSDSPWSEQLAALEILQTKRKAMCVFWLHEEKHVSGSISRDGLHAMPSAIREDLLNFAEIIHTNDEYVAFIIPYGIEFDRIYESIRRYEKNKSRSEARNRNLYSLSDGFYEQSDIDRIFDIQKGLCYYSSEPLSRRPKNYSIDHIVPVTEGGSSWPDNLALAITNINREKHNYPKDRFLLYLKKRYGNEWHKNQVKFCKSVDIEREKIGLARQNEVKAKLKRIESGLKAEHPGDDIEYALLGGTVELMINNHSLTFPAGFLRRKRLYSSYEYIANIARKLIESTRP